MLSSFKKSVLEMFFSLELDQPHQEWHNFWQIFPTQYHSMQLIGFAHLVSKQLHVLLIK
jgi:hypothetical protein